MRHVERFNRLLVNTVDLDQSRLDDLDSRVGAIMRYLRGDATLGALIVTHVPQGSWAHRTIIKPVPNDEFDADILLQLRDVRDWSREPRRYIDEVHRAFGRSGRYRDLTERKNRCVRIHYANQCHVDIVPYLVRGFFPLERKVIVNRAENHFEPTDPDGFTAWIRHQDGRTNGNLRKAIRLFKYLRDRKDAFVIPSVILTTVLGKQVHWWWELAERYQDLPTAFTTLTASMDRWLQQYSSVPRIPDPSGSGATFHHRWNEHSFMHFRNEVHGLATKTREAYAEKDQGSSIRLWQRVFGPSF